MLGKNELYLFYKTVYLKIKTQFCIRMLFKFFEISIIYPSILAEK